MTPETKSILMNKEMIAVNQDTLGMQATCYRDNGDYQIWVKGLSNSDKAICLLNKGDEKKTVLVDFSLLAQIRTMNRRFRPPTAAAGAPAGFGGFPGGGFGAAAPAAPAPPQPFSTPRPLPGAAAQAGAPGAPPAGMQRGGTPLTLANYTVRDLWDHKDLTLKETSFYVELPPHSVKVYRFIKK
jgi:hypothetical protein